MSLVSQSNTAEPLRCVVWNTLNPHVCVSIQTQKRLIYTVHESRVPEARFGTMNERRGGR